MAKPQRLRSTWDVNASPETLDEVDVEQAEQVAPQAGKDAVAKGHCGQQGEVALEQLG